MNRKKYKYRSCAVPLCTNTSIKTPEKLFIFVPFNKKIRSQWLKLARRDLRGISPKTELYFCEDHFDLPNDMDNYMEYHVMGSVSKIRMKQTCVPLKFECQPDRRKRTSQSNERQYIVKKRRKKLIEEIELEVQKKTNTTICTEQLKLEDSSPGISNFTSPFKIKSSKTTKPFISDLQKCTRKLIAIEADSDVLYTPSLAHSESPSVKSLKIKSSSDCSKSIEDDKKATTILAHTIQKIVNNPQSYIGVPDTCYHLIHFIKEELNIPTHLVFMCLKKIKLNNSFRELSHEFSICETYASKIFLKIIPVIASLMRPFIVALDKDSIRENFRYKNYSVSCIIDCVEIEIQKPSNAQNQFLTWSVHKNTNTIKYLVSCSSYGLVNYISPGFGGRITDTCLVQSCDFVKCLPPGMYVMAYRGLKHVEQCLSKQGMYIVRPSSVAIGMKLSELEAKETKQITSLSIHIERVIRRIHEFNMLKPHACVNDSLVKVLDDVMTIACGLINLQDSLI